MQSFNLSQWKLLSKVRNRLKRQLKIYMPNTPTTLECSQLLPDTNNSKNDLSKLVDDHCLKSTESLIHKTLKY